MSKKSNVVKDAQLKARRTSLDKKDRDELINIILRKDSTERKNNAKIQELTNLLKEADEINKQKATDVENLTKDVDKLYDNLKTKQEQIDNLTIDCNNYSYKSSCLARLCNFRRKVIIGCLAIIILLIIGLFL